MFSVFPLRWTAPKPAAPIIDSNDMKMDAYYIAPPAVTITPIWLIFNPIYWQRPAPTPSPKNIRHKSARPRTALSLSPNNAYLKRQKERTRPGAPDGYETSVNYTLIKYTRDHHHHQHRQHHPGRLLTLPSSFVGAPPPPPPPPPPPIT